MMTKAQRVAMNAWLENIAQYGGQDGNRIEIIKQPNGSVTVREEGLRRHKRKLIVSGLAKVTIDPEGTVRTMTGLVVE